MYLLTSLRQIDCPIKKPFMTFHDLPIPFFFKFWNENIYHVYMKKIAGIFYLILVLVYWYYFESDARLKVDKYTSSSTRLPIRV